MTGCCANDGSQPAEDTYDMTREYYGQVLSTNKDLQTTACTAAGRPTGVVAELIAKVCVSTTKLSMLQHCLTPASQIPDEVVSKFYGAHTSQGANINTSPLHAGCGAPLPLGIDGLTVLDLGSGSGRDAYVCAALVGEQGRVIGVDMTKEQLDVANAHKDEFARRIGDDRCNMDFRHGTIECVAVRCGDVQTNNIKQFLFMNACRQ